MNAVQVAGLVIAALGVGLMAGAIPLSVVGWDHLTIMYKTSWYPVPGGYAVQIPIKVVFDRSVYDPGATWLVVELYDDSGRLVGSRINATFQELFAPNEYGQVIVGDTVSKPGVYKYHVHLEVHNKGKGVLKLDFYPVVDTSKESSPVWRQVYPRQDIVLPPPKPVVPPAEPITTTTTTTSPQATATTSIVKDTNVSVSTGGGVADNNTILGMIMTLIGAILYAKPGIIGKIGMS